LPDIFHRDQGLLCGLRDRPAISRDQGALLRDGAVTLGGELFEPGKVRHQMGLKFFLSGHSNS
jgi:hypothetical protein